MNSLLRLVNRIWGSSIGKKWIVAITGALLVFFLLAHMAGNLLIFQSSEAINEYAYFLHHMLHGWGIWISRIGLLTMFVLHIAATISLTLHNRQARGQQYAYETTVQASKSSRIMIWSGLTVIAFVFFHIFHFTVRLDPELAGMKEVVDGKERHDVHRMVITGFQKPAVVVFYLIGVTLLCSHLSHGIASIFQTIGIRSKGTRDPFKALGWAISIALWIGFLAVPLTSIFGIIETDEQGSAKSAALIEPVADESSI